MSTSHSHGNALYFQPFYWVIIFFAIAMCTQCHPIIKTSTKTFLSSVKDRRAGKWNNILENYVCEQHTLKSIQFLVLENNFLSMGIHFI